MDESCYLQPHLGTEKNPSTNTLGNLSFLRFHLNLTGSRVLKNGNMLLSQTASIKSSRVSKLVVSTGRLFGNNSRCANATTPSLSLMIVCASSGSILSISTLSNGRRLPMAFPLCTVRHSSQTRNAASRACAGGV